MVCIPMFGRKKPQKGYRFSEFTVFGAFVAVAVFGLGYGILAAALGRVHLTPLGEAAPWRPQPAMNADEYEYQAAEVMSPLLGQSLSMSKDDLSPDNAALRQLVDKTQERLLRIQRIPADHKDAHLRAVLLLDQWKRALSGSEPDREAVLGKTKELVDEYSWFLM